MVVVEGSLAQQPRVSPFDHSLHSNEWTAKLHVHKVLGYLGVYVDDLLIVGKRLSSPSRP